jgi:ribosome-associated protein
MITEYVQNLKENQGTLYYAKSLMKILYASKIESLRLYDTKNLPALASFYIVGTLLNENQAESVVRLISKEFKKFFTIKYEGAGTPWILIDAGDIIIHLFLQEARKIYSIESLWKNFEEISFNDSDYLL